MKYDANTYAKAFTEAVSGEHGGAKKDAIIKNFAALIVKNGDANLFPKIVDTAAKLLREKNGIAKVAFETARPLTPGLKKRLHALVNDKDEIEEKVVPSLIAGVRIVKNDEEQFDMTLASRLQKMLT